jgi:HPt (histidine-containing phosphotransfer) domain-containing protein
VKLAQPPSADGLTPVRDQPRGADPRPVARPPAPPESFDPAWLLELAGRDGMTEFTDMFIAQMSVRLPELADAIAHCEPGAVYRIAHALKGSAATVGTPGVMRVCEAICTLAQEGSCVGAAELQAELVAAWNDAARAMADYLEATAP